MARVTSIKMQNENENEIVITGAGAGVINIYGTCTSKWMNVLSGILQNSWINLIKFGANLGAHKYFIILRNSKLLFNVENYIVKINFISDLQWLKRCLIKYK